MYNSLNQSRCYLSLRIGRGTGQTAAPLHPSYQPKNKNKNNLPLTYFTVQLLTAIGIPSYIIRAVHNFLLLFPELHVVLKLTDKYNSAVSISAIVISISIGFLIFITRTRASQSVGFLMNVLHLLYT